MAWLRSRYGVSIEKKAGNFAELAASFKEARRKEGLATPDRRLTKHERDAVVIPPELLEMLPIKKDKIRWSYEACLHSLAEYLRLPGTHTLKRYQAIYTENGWPSLHAIQRHANFGPMLDAARIVVRSGEIVPIEETRTNARKAA